MTILSVDSGELALRFGQHLALTLSALAIALIVAVPAGIAAARNATVRRVLFGIFGTVYTIPSLAALALLVPVFGLGFFTALIALVAYAQMILIRAVATGLRSVPPEMSDAAAGLGMTAAQRFMRVELPQAAPVIVAGIRVAVVALIAIANLAAWIDAGGLGTLIFDGLRRDIPQKIIAGALASALLAILADTALRKLETETRRRSALT